ncbi:MAG: addiction module component [Symploca sp. SIO1B1]|nr:addiction module component [Symploca sp. SIO1B1]
MTIENLEAEVLALPKDSQVKLLARLLEHLGHNNEFVYRGNQVNLTQQDEDIVEETWLLAASRNPVFDDLYDQEEDIYSLSEGKPFHD